MKLIETQADFGRGSAIWQGSGNGKQTLHFAAANGFPVGAYREFLSHFADHYTVVGLENRGIWPEAKHPPHFFYWRQHALDLIAFLQHRRDTGADQQPVIAIGHSIGGTVSAIAARHRPDLFQALIMIDPATTPGKNLGHLPLPLLQALMARHPLVTGTRKRRRNWPSRRHFIDSMAKKAVYRRFSAVALQDYAEAGLTITTQGDYALRYAPEWEAHNFQTTNIPWRALQHMPVPTLLLRAEQSYLHPESQFQHFAKRFSPKVEHQQIDGVGHMAIQEDLSQVLHLCQQWLRQKQLFV